MDTMHEPLSLGSNDVEPDWTIFWDTTYAAVIEVIDIITCKHQDLFDKNMLGIEALLEKKHNLQRALLNETASVSEKTVFGNTRGAVQWDLHQIQDSWLSKKVDSIQLYADHNDMKNL